MWVTKIEEGVKYVCFHLGLLEGLGRRDGLAGGRALLGRVATILRLDGIVGDRRGGGCNGRQSRFLVLVRLAVAAFGHSCDCLKGRTGGAEVSDAWDQPEG